MTAPHFASYVYVRGNPCLLRDPSGLAVENGGGWQFEIDLSGLLPCDPAEFGVGFGQQLIGDFYVAKAAVEVYVTGGLAWPVGVADAAFGFYHVFEGGQRMVHSYECEPF